MKGITKVVLSLGVVAGGYGLFKLIGKEPSKYSLDWIKRLIRYSMGIRKRKSLSDCLFS